MDVINKPICKLLYPDSPESINIIDKYWIVYQIKETWNQPLNEDTSPKELR